MQPSPRQVQTPQRYPHQTTTTTNRNQEYFYQPKPKEEKKLEKNLPVVFGNPDYQINRHQKVETRIINEGNIRKNSIPKIYRSQDMYQYPKSPVPQSSKMTITLANKKSYKN